MKFFKPFLLSLFVVWVLTNLSFADNISVKNISSQQTCSPSSYNRDYVYYLGSSDSMADSFLNGDEYIRTFNYTQSYISIWDPSNVLNVTSWQWKSNGKPKGINRVIAVSSDAWITIKNKPSNYTSRSTVAAQVVYNINANAYDWREWNANTIIYNMTNTYKWSGKLNASNQVKPECLNVHIGFCGDGILDNGSSSASTNINAPLAGWEQCDPADPQKTNWGNAGCNATCQPINQQAGKGVITKTLIGDGIVTKIGDEVKWKIVVSAQGWPITNFTIVDKLPTELGYVSYRVVSAPSGISVNAPTGTTTKTVSWKVDGILQAGESIELELTTKVVVLPAANQKVKNVACLILGDTELCDDANITTPWTPKITKTLIGDGIITKIGDEVRWKIVVSAQGWPITNFTIVDKLPTELDYASYRVVSKPSGITVNAPTGTSTKTINWKVDGTLNEGEVIEIELTTKVVRMPAADAKVKNVACLVISGTELCDEASTGAPGIEKTLIGDGIVTKVGDIVEWIITVKANGGSITNFNIVDKLPEELGYDSYVVVSKPSGITVNAPTGTSTKTINWKVDGTLNEGETIELKVTTKVVKMPADNQKVENVACLVVSGTEICDEEYIGKPFIEKTLIGSGVVSYTGEIVNWNIIAKPNGGFIEDFQFIENFKIVDGVPVQLEYVGYEVVHVPNGVVVSSPTTWSTATGTLVTWNVQGRVAGDEYVQLKVITRVVIMPKPGEVITNIACLVLDEDRQLCDEATTISDKPALWLKKYFSDRTKEVKTYKIGDIVGYRIEFGNTGSGAASFVSIKDFLPQNLSYISSQISLSYGGHTQIISGWINIDIFSGMTIPGGAAGYMLLTGQITAEYTTSTTNLACIYLEDQKVECDEVTYKLENPKLVIEKTVNKTEVNIGDEVTFTLKITNQGDMPMSGFTVTDTLPSELSFVLNSEGWASSDFWSFEEKGRQLIWSNYTKILQKNQSIILTFKATVNKIGEHTNWVCLTHLDFPNWEPDSNNPENCDPADVVVREKAYCTHPNPKNIDEYRDSLRRSITCETEGKKTARSIVLDCGNGTTFIASNVSSLTETCIYDRGSSTTKTFTPRCIVNGSDYNPIDNYTCSGKVVLRKSSGSGMGYCGDNEATDWEDCDCGRGNPKDCPLSQAIRNPSQVSSSKWDDYRNKGYRCINCKIQGKGDISAVEPIACFNINNGSISIEEGEMLPFYWNIEKIDNDQYVDVDGYDNEDAIEAYNRLSKNAGLGDATNGGKTGLTCDDYEHGDIALNAMVCTFRVYNWLELQSEGDYVYEIQIPCFTKGTDNQIEWERSNIIDSFVNRNKNNFIANGSQWGDTFWSFNLTKDRGYAFRSSVFIINNFGRSDTNGKLLTEWSVKMSSTPISQYGEYKLSLHAVNYVQCVDRYWTAQEPYPRVCDVNFSVTKPYILQKTPSGTITATTNVLDKYKMFADGTDVFAYSELNKILAVTSKDYSANTQVEKAMQDFITKYQKLAVKVNLGYNNGISTTAEVKKVPGKDIYFVNGDMNLQGYYYTYDESKSVKTRTYGRTDVFKKPFTIIQTAGNTVIEGNLDHNIMLLTKGYITFDGQYNCDDTQTVKGIFYTAQGFKSVGVSKNYPTSNKRCIGGNLQIKGIAIGNGMENVTAERRANLNEWFYTKNNILATKASRRQDIMNGASVLIEYAPSVFTTATMPPGAEEFTTALSVYRK